METNKIENQNHCSFSRGLPPRPPLQNKQGLPPRPRFRTGKDCRPRLPLWNKEGCRPGSASEEARLPPPVPGRSSEGLSSRPLGRGHSPRRGFQEDCVLLAAGGVLSLSPPIVPPPRYSASPSPTLPWPSPGRNLAPMAARNTSLLSERELSGLRPLTVVKNGLSESMKALKSGP